ncbi:helix-turn-helix domain-containing protein [Paenibacillus sedimenti]|uniref:Helix-turn-helix transcriptional regulator n=1 Tax=Paenibacillus sedimenti TaxID=2770274 RepID=A0A926QKU2_9BACL|nr:AraC family transcriptional regulator [Paenibacillus sedimenti]MBD0381867.1 helix-turn-helix transcriptional regulator [Paenibacillus sedimenti]
MIQIKRCGHNVVHPSGFTIDRPYGSGDYLFLLFRSKMEIEIRGEMVTVDKNTYIVYRKGSKQLYKDFEQPMVHDWFHFDAEDMEDFCERLNLPFDTLLEARDPFFISRKVGEIQGELIHNGNFRREIMDATVRCLLMKLSDLRNRIESNNQIIAYYDQFIALRNEIYHSPSVSYSIDELAAKVNMSRSYFQLLYKEIFGISVIHDVINNRLEYGKYLLENTTSVVKEIASLCGYENDVHFMRQFKKYMGATPSQYRSTYRSPNSKRE